MGAEIYAVSDLGVQNWWVVGPAWAVLLIGGTFTLKWWALKHRECAHAEDWFAWFGVLMLLVLMVAVGLVVPFMA